MPYEHNDHAPDRGTMTDTTAKKPEAPDNGYVRLIRMRRLAKDVYKRQAFGRQSPVA